MKLVKNSVVNLLPTVVGVLTSILTIPLYISLIGTDRYGALLVGFVLLGYFGHVDFGLGRAITHRLSSNKEESAVRAGIVWSALVGAAGIAVLGGVVVFIAARVFFGSFFEADEALRVEALAASWLFAMCVPIILFTGVSSGAVISLERFGTVSFATVVGNLLSQLLPLLVAALHLTDLSWLLGASVLGRLASLILIMTSMWRNFLLGQRLVASLQQLRSLFTYGSWIMVTAIVGPLMIMSDRLVIGAAVSAAAVVAYSVPFQIASRTAMLPGSVAQVLFPRLASQTPEQSLALGKVSVVVIGQLYAFMVVGLICLAGPLLQLWLGDDLDPRSVLIGQIIIIGFWTNALAYVPFTLIQASGNSRFTGIMHLAELPVYLAMLFGLGLTIGLAGIALAFTLRTTLDCVVLFVKAGFTDQATLGRLIGPACGIGVALLAAQWIDGWLSALTLATAVCIPLLVLCWIQVPEAAKRAVLARFGAAAA
ncbi:oligosaccharide flippase family protein [Erythrobacter neustonensis]|uniref:oligosaccharide flippase family protein n=1 Tax=Erythrobacter neustonensis TaxID=1112 RepID=UPI0018D30DC5|nr:oligosaccharide flippase family protein [Erythrobacter neustonensis]